MTIEEAIIKVLMVNRLKQNLDSYKGKLHEHDAKQAADDLMRKLGIIK